MAISLVDDGPASMDDLLALLSCPFSIPMIGDQGKSIVLGETCCNPIFLDMGAKKVNAGEERFAIIIASHYKVVVERVGLIPLLIAE